VKRLHALACNTFEPIDGFLNLLGDPLERRLRGDFTLSFPANLKKPQTLTPQAFCCGFAES
jgi:hypothetical protein